MTKITAMVKAMTKRTIAFATTMGKTRIKNATTMAKTIATTRRRCT
jgi:hypothetical protein